jgi:hypothetical protein
LDLASIFGSAAGVWSGSPALERNQFPLSVDLVSCRAHRQSMFVAHVSHADCLMPHPWLHRRAQVFSFSLVFFVRRFALAWLSDLFNLSKLGAQGLISMHG